MRLRNLLEPGIFFFTAACTGQVPVVTLLLHAGKGFMHLHVYAVC